MNDPIRVLCVFGKLNRGGAETMCMNLYRHIDRTKVQFDFVKHTHEACAYDKEILSLGGKIYEAPRYRLYNSFIYKRWWCKHFKEHPEHKIIHGHMFTIASVYLQVAKQCGRKTICHSHIANPYSNSFEEYLKVFMVQNVNKVSDYKFACSKLAGDYLYKGEKYIVLNNAIDTQSFIYDRNTALKTREAIGFKEDDFVIGTVGRLTQQKNPDKIISILSNLMKKDEEFKFIWIGVGELEQHIKEMIKAYNLEDSIHMLGSRGDVNALLMAMDIFLLPSLYEGLPVSVIEAQAAGVPCVISDTITKEVCITQLVKRVGLNDTDEDWCNAINASIVSGRQNNAHIIMEAGYDIRESSEWLCNFYISIS